MTTTTVDGAFYANPIPGGFAADSELTALTGTDTYVMTFTAFRTEAATGITVGALNTTNLYAQIFGADGRPTGDLIAINVDGDFVDRRYDVAALDNGNFLVAGIVNTDNTNVPLGQIFSATGTKVGDRFQIGDGETDTRSDVNILAETGGGFTLTYRDRGNVNQSIHSIQTFDATGTPLAPERALVGPFTDADRPILLRVDPDVEVFGAARHYELVERPDGSYDITAPAIQENGGILQDGFAGRQPAIALEGGHYAMSGGVTTGDSVPTMQIFRVTPADGTGGLTSAVRVDDPDVDGVQIGFTLSDAVFASPGTGGALLVARPGGGVVAIWQEDTSRMRTTDNPRFQTGFDIMSQVFDENFNRVGGIVTLYGATDTDTYRLNNATLTDDGRIYVQTTQVVPAGLEGVEGGDIFTIFGNFFDIGANGLVQVDVAPGEGGEGGGGTEGGATSGPDTLTGTNKADEISGLGGNDTISGGRGNDTLEGNTGRDRIDGGAGKDALYGGGGRDELTGGGGADRLSGGGGADALYGGGGRDQLFGGGGKDALYGGGGNDRLFGGGGNDILEGGRGNDVMEGGKGRDTFIFAQNFGKDTITDFSPAQDTIAFAAGNREAGGFNAFIAASTEVGDDVVYDRGNDGKNVLTLQDVDLDMLTRANFDFG